MFLKLLVLISALTVFSVSARADSIITGGTVSLISNLGVQVTPMSFGGAGFSVNATGRTVVFGSILPCSAGCSANSLLNLSATAGGWTVGDLSGFMTINGTSYTFVTGIGLPNPPNVWGSGGMRFTAGSVLIPDTNDLTITLTSTFITVPTQSSINGSYSGGFVTTGALFGVGSVTLTLRQQFPGTYIGQSAVYSFVQPTPEPTTLILLGSGILGIIAKRRLKRH